MKPAYQIVVDSDIKDVDGLITVSPKLAAYFGVSDEEENLTIEVSVKHDKITQDKLNKINKARKKYGFSQLKPKATS